MESNKTKAKYQEWLSPEIIHKATLNWLSELNFIQDENLFFDDLIKSYTLQLIEAKHFNEGKVITDELKEIKKETNRILEVVTMHEKALQILVDGIDQIKEEEAYRKEHLRLIIDVSNFQKKHREIKKRIFKLIKNILKEGKQKRLLE
jgi:hypothetical protein